MRIISVRNGFAPDHSSTSYEFAAVDRALDREARARVASLSRRANPTRRTVKFVYNVEGYDIPGGWEPLMRDYYDVMWCNDYDWWTLAVAFNASKERQEELARYEFYGTDDMGVRVSTYDNRVIVSIRCQLEPGTLVDLEEDYYEEDWEEEAEVDGNGYEPDDPLLNLLTQIRRQLMDGDYRALYAVWEKYGQGGEEAEPDEGADKPPVPQERPTGAWVIERLRNMLVTS
ncbi:MAG: hypothetical protein AB1700_04720 [Bacillota bacterium]